MRRLRKRIVGIAVLALLPAAAHASQTTGYGGTQSAAKTDARNKANAQCKQTNSKWVQIPAGAGMGEPYKTASGQWGVSYHYTCKSA